MDPLIMLPGLVKGNLPPRRIRASVQCPSKAKLVIAQLCQKVAPKVPISKARRNMPCSRYGCMTTEGRIRRIDVVLVYSHH
ncbi:hypothetical protein GDO81_014222 [Engystomops pustulosus]|uniref:Uncharacterized protein n=1 Tax=Engystomops pustulosus TaxID=76066 RepID=A0AAV7B994_ENGPU|nr:hypothetical protein GDO81_014222 [Engystomops pustulosus]